MKLGDNPLLDFFNLDFQSLWNSYLEVSASACNLCSWIIAKTKIYPHILFRLWIAICFCSKGFYVNFSISCTESEAYLGSSQRSMMEFFLEIVNS